MNSSNNNNNNSNSGNNTNNNNNNVERACCAWKDAACLCQSHYSFVVQLRLIRINNGVVAFTYTISLFKHTLIVQHVERACCAWKDV